MQTFDDDFKDFINPDNSACMTADEFKGEMSQLAEEHGWPIILDGYREMLVQKWEFPVAKAEELVTRLKAEMGV